MVTLQLSKILVTCCFGDPPPLCLWHLSVGNLQLTSVPPPPSPGRKKLKQKCFCSRFQTLGQPRSLFGTILQWQATLYHLDFLNILKPWMVFYVSSIPMLILCYFLRRKACFPQWPEAFEYKVAYFLNMQGPLFTFYLFFSKHRTISSGQVVSWFIVRWCCSCLTCLLCTKPDTHICYLQCSFCTGILA